MKVDFSKSKWCTLGIVSLENDNGYQKWSEYNGIADKSDYSSVYDANNGHNMYGYGEPLEE